MYQWLKRAIVVASVVCAAAAVAQEMQKPAEERAWNGLVFGFVPYDFRTPTPERIMAAWWNPEDPRILTPHVYGVGWSINIPSLMRTAYAFGAQMRNSCDC
jgi:hypothetical protein